MPFTGPVFLLALPRSGSTLLQSALAASTDIATAAEPWVLIPILQARHERGVRARYDHPTLVNAIGDFVADTVGVDAYRAAVRAYADILYGSAMRDGERMFVDKTPRYHVFTRDIHEVFPDSRAIFLWRNPLAIAASIAETWGHGNWNLGRYDFDLFVGLAGLTAGRSDWGAAAIDVRYEDLVRRPDDTMHRLWDFLGARPGHVDASLAPSPMSGRMGDTAGPAKYSGFSQSSVQAWPEWFAGIGRRRWAERYVNWIGDDRLATMGYSRREILDDLRRPPLALSTSVRDAWQIPTDAARSAVKRLWTGSQGRLG